MDCVVEVESPNTRYTEKYIEADYRYETTLVKRDKGVLKVVPRCTRVQFRTSRHVGRVGVMLVGWGGNNGTTVTGAVLAHKHRIAWKTKDGTQRPTYYGSLIQSGTVCLGRCEEGGGVGEEVHVAFRDLLPLVRPHHDIVFGGWDLSSLHLADAMERARVFDYHLQAQLAPHMRGLVPLPAVYDPRFIAPNQASRADNVLSGTKFQQMQEVRRHIREFREQQGVEKVIVVWTANTERFCEVREGLNDTWENLLNSIREDHSEVSPSTLYAVASILEDCAYINGSPQNTFVPGVLELAETSGVMIGGDDFKSGQTKLKSVLVDFLIGAGIKPVSLVSYNHLGNNDGRNLSAPLQFRSKEVSKSNVVDDMVASNPVLYAPGEKPDHCVVIKYVPSVGDSKRALDEYTSEIMMNGRNTLVCHNTCEDSLLAAPLILDLVILTELCQRISFRLHSTPNTPFQPLHPALSILGYLCKAPLVPRGAPLVNALSRQRQAVENLFRACLGLAPFNPLDLEHRMSDPTAWSTEQPDVINKSEAEHKTVNGFVNPLKKEFLAEDIVLDTLH